MSSASPNRCATTNLGDPQFDGADINWVAVPGNTTSAPWMTTCCDPKPVHAYADGCGLWCEMDLAKEPHHDPVRLGATYFHCFNEHGRENRSEGGMWHYIPVKKDGDGSAAAGRAPSVIGAVVMSVLLMGMVLVG
ncbi:uncharacterized protein C8A04DRAFT_10639 [Dichotomopilus funicola]|uniref:Uncharacterized protein n=1 Tax=Dichotomopilus funicola TaxID=1934379 RepID=A0AAN6ZN75_9PEZI|nr:hypothetical protein C8A04DRAFT_10639 [Dichotomopilus funicola]